MLPLKTIPWPGVSLLDWSLPSTLLLPPQGAHRKVYFLCYLRSHRLWARLSCNLPFLVPDMSLLLNGQLPRAAQQAVATLFGKVQSKTDLMDRKLWGMRMGNCLCPWWCKASPHLVCEIHSKFLLSLISCKQNRNQLCHQRESNRKADPHQVTGGVFSDPDGPYWASALRNSQKYGCVFLSDSEHANTFSPASLLKALSMQMGKYATYSKFSLSAFAQLAKTQGDFSSNIIWQMYLLPTYFSLYQNISQLWYRSWLFSWFQLIPWPLSVVHFSLSWRKMNLSQTFLECSGAFDLTNHHRSI